MLDKKLNCENLEMSVDEILNSIKSMTESEGRKARINGKNIDENPFLDSDTELFDSWETGYLSVNKRPDNPPPPPVRPVAWIKNEQIRW